MTNRTNVWILLGIIVLFIAVAGARSYHEGFASDSVPAPAAVPVIDKEQETNAAWKQICQTAQSTGFRDSFMTVTQALPESCREAIEVWMETKDVTASTEMLEQSCLSPERRIQYLGLLVLEHLREWMTTQRLGMTTFCRQLQLAIEKVPNPEARQWLSQFQEQCRTEPTDEGVTEACAISYRRWAYDGLPLPSGCSKEVLLRQVDRLFALASRLRGEALAVFCTAVHRLVQEVQNPEMRMWLQDKMPCNLTERESALRDWYAVFSKATETLNLPSGTLSLWNQAMDRREILERCAAAEAPVGAVSFLAANEVDLRTERKATLLDRSPEPTMPTGMVQIRLVEDPTLMWTATAKGMIELRRSSDSPASLWRWVASSTPEGKTLQSVATGLYAALLPNGSLRLVTSGASVRQMEMVADGPSKSIFFRNPPMMSIHAPLNSFQQIQEGVVLEASNAGTPWHVEPVPGKPDMVLLFGNEERTSAMDSLRVSPADGSLFGRAMPECSLSGWVFFEQNPDEALYLVNQPVPLWQFTVDGSPPPLALIVKANARGYRIGIRVQTMTGKEEVRWSKLELLPRKWMHIGLVVDGKTFTVFHQGEQIDALDLEEDPLMSGLSPMIWEIWPVNAIQGVARGWIGRNFKVRLEDMRKDMTRYNPVAVSQVVPHDVIAKREDGGILLPMGEKSMPYNAILHHPVGWSWPSGMQLPELPIYLEYRWPQVMRIRRILLQGAGLSYPLVWRVSYLDEASGVFVPVAGDLQGPMNEHATLVHELPQILETGSIRIHLVKWRGRPALRTGFHGDVAQPRRATHHSNQPIRVFSASATPAAQYAPSSAVQFTLGRSSTQEAYLEGGARVDPNSNKPSSEQSVIEVCRHLQQVQPGEYGSLKDCVQSLYQRLTQSR